MKGVYSADFTPRMSCKNVSCVPLLCKKRTCTPLLPFVASKKLAETEGGGLRFAKVDQGAH